MENASTLIVLIALELFWSFDHSLFVISLLIVFSMIFVILIRQIDTASHLIKVVVVLTNLILRHELFIATAVIVHENLERFVGRFGSFGALLFRVVIISSIVLCLASLACWREHPWAGGKTRPGARRRQRKLVLTQLLLHPLLILHYLLQQGQNRPIFHVQLLANFRFLRGSICHSSQLLRHILGFTTGGASRRTTSIKRFRRTFLMQVLRVRRVNNGVGGGAATNLIETDVLAGTIVDAAAFLGHF